MDRDAVLQASIVGKQDEAMGRYQEALKAHPGFPPVLYNLGVSSAESQQVGIAFDELIEALSFSGGKSHGVLQDDS